MYDKRRKSMVCWVPIMLLGMVSGLSAAVLAQEETMRDEGWPRQFEQGGNEVIVYQPQIDDWADHKTMKARAALAVTTPADQQAVYGILEIEAQTVVNNAERLVTLQNQQRSVRFPSVDQAKAAALTAVVNGVLPPAKPLTLSLDRVLAYLDETHAVQKEVEVSLDPPTIFYSDKPAVLVIFMGQPAFKPVAGHELMFAANTNWDVLLDTTESRYYLLDGEGWITAQDPVKGPWTAVTGTPAVFSQIPDDENWAEVRKHIPGTPAKSVPAVFAATQPAELIQTSGEPSYTPIKGTKLLQVANTDSALFLHSGEGQHYFLVAGRWFRAKSLAGPWSAATMDLPADFASIPSDSPSAEVKASVKGTREAMDAVLLASVPNTAKIPKNEVNLTVDYSGEPKFVAIEGTAVKFASNTGYDVFRVDSGYYCCNEGAWFCAAAATGPWTLCESIPQAIYAIPPSSPKHNVTYVVIEEDDDPDHVTYSYTSGYEGSYVANGLLVFGAGMLLGAALADDWFDCCHNYPPCWYSYGCGAHYGYAYGGYYRAAHYYGPYGGAGRGAYYNTATGTYARGAYAYGPYGSASAGAAFNPYTGGYARGGRVSTDYGSAGRFYAQQGSRAAWGGYRSTDQGTVGGVRTSRGTGAVGWNTDNNQGGAVRTRSGDVYVGNDGNVYKREDGQWQRYGDDGWQSAGRAEARSTAGRPVTTGTDAARQRGQVQPGGGATRPSTRPVERQRTDAGSSANVSQRLDRDAAARDWGNQRAASAGSFSGQRAGSLSRDSLGGGGGRSSGGGRGGGGGGRGGGGRGR